MKGTVRRLGDGLKIRMGKWVGYEYVWKKEYCTVEYLAFEKRLLGLNHSGGRIRYLE